MPGPRVERVVAVQGLRIMEQAIVPSRTPHGATRPRGYLKRG